MTQRIGIGIVGAGRMGSIHARLITRSVPEARLVGIADVNFDAARRVTAQLEDPSASDTPTSVTAVQRANREYLRRFGI